MGNVAANFPGQNSQLRILQAPARHTQNNMFKVNRDHRNRRNSLPYQLSNIQTKQTHNHARRLPPAQLIGTIILGKPNL